MNRTEMNAMSDKDLLSRYESLTETCRFWEGQRYIYHIGGKEFMYEKRKHAEFKREIKRRMKSTDIQPSEDAINALERLHELSNNDELYRLYSILFDAVHGKGATR